ncbi:MAG: long-chain fatty acid--CoA ligase [Candidatus Dormiibacterota bacterium]
MQGEMQDFPLTMQHVLWRIERLFKRSKIFTKVDGGIHEYSNAEMLENAGRLANALQRLGLRRGDRVATMAWNNRRHLEMYYAGPTSGLVLHTLNPRLFPDQLAFIVNEAEDSALFVDRTLLPALSQIADRLPASLHTIVVMNEGGGPLPENPFPNLLDYDTLLGVESTEFAWPVLDEREAAALCYTSGTTGHPKGVLYSHRSQFLHTMMVTLAEGAGLRESDGVLAVVPMFHVNSWGLPYGAGLSGANLVLPDRWMGDPAALVELVKASNATLMAGVPTVWLGLCAYLEKTGERLPSVRSVLCGGSAASPALIDRLANLGLDLQHAWGMTETSPIATMAGIRSWLTPDEVPSAHYSQGLPVPGIEIRIVDLATGAELPWDGQTIGEVHCRGPWVASQYYQNTDPSKFGADGWMHTGDVATIDQYGYIRIVDRIKDVIKSGGEWISSVDLESAVMAHPKVQEAAVIGVPDPKWQERPIAFVVPREEFKGQVTSEEILDFLRERVANWWLPEEIRFIDEVPKTATGKFDKKALRPPVAEVPAT